MEEEKLIHGEANKFLPIEKVNIYGDNIGYVELYDSSHANESEAQRIWTVTQICSLAYGNESAKNPEALYERMKSIKHESLWEFIRYGTNGSSTIRSSMRNANIGDAYSELPEYIRDVKTDVNTHKQNIVCFRIKVPIFVARQFMRHRSFSYLEMSRRYTKGSKQPFEFWFPKDMLGSFYASEQPSIWMEEYSNLVGIGVHTQVASRFLPQTTYTEFYMMGEVSGLQNFFRLRLDEHAQLEIREVAEAMLSLLFQYQPELHSKVLCEQH